MITRVKTNVKNPRRSKTMYTITAWSKLFLRFIPYLSSIVSFKECVGPFEEKITQLWLKQFLLCHSHIWGLKSILKHSIYLDIHIECRSGCWMHPMVIILWASIWVYLHWTPRMCGLALCFFVHYEPFREYYCNTCMLIIC